MRALIVEDQTELRSAVAKRVRAHGHAADEACDGATALFPDVRRPRGGEEPLPAPLP